ncbi:FtsX-like permease family protein [Bifidobacterium sp. ESL0732]|uniref:FtsX-like permease family protein n=1 Tax=Bifidobacterium sp. ESL0732 TaxID=2983222 RepID=UPI0023F7CDDE|nr:FtsX-like permease family protein [Bifidobacterium sp. ESL0732]WEV64195.1 FtsX-like permease family protein [Bifidobacterium sp. ESL0732]
MFVLTNAWSSVIRHKWRSILMLLVAGIMIFGVVFATAVSSANDKAHGEIYQAQAPIAVIRPTAAMENKLKGDDASSVKKYMTFDDYGTYAMSLQQIGVQQPQFSIGISLPMKQAGTTKAIAGKSDVSSKKTGGETTLYSYYDKDGITINPWGSFKIDQGKSLNYQGKDGKNVLVSQAFARKNNLHVGSTLTLGNPMTSDTYKLTVRGIYAYTDPAPAGHGSDAKLAKENRDNAIYAEPSVLTANNLLSDNAEGWLNPRFDVGFKLGSVDQYTAFTQAVKAMKLPKGYQVSSPTLDHYNATIKPLETLNNTMVKVRIGLYAGGGIILLLLVGFALRRRSDEIAMDMIIGVTRARVGWQFSLETLIPTVPGLLIGGIAGALCAKPLGKALAQGIATPAVSACWMAMWYSIAIVAALAVIAFLRPAFAGVPRIFETREAVDSATTGNAKADSATQSAVENANAQTNENADDDHEADAKDREDDGKPSETHDDRKTHDDNASEDDTEAQA